MSKSTLAHLELELYASLEAETSSIRRGMKRSMSENYARQKRICRIRDIIKTLIETNIFVSYQKIAN